MFNEKVLNFVNECEKDKIFHIRKILWEKECFALQADRAFYKIFPFDKGERCTFSFFKRKSTKKK